MPNRTNEVARMHPLVSNMKRLGEDIRSRVRSVTFAGGQRPPLEHFMQEHDIHTVCARQMTHGRVLACGEDAQCGFIVLKEVETWETMQQNLPQGNRRQRLGPHPVVGSNNLRFGSALGYT